MRYLLLAAYLVFAWRRLSTYLHIFQQEEYDPVRFVRWLVKHAFARSSSLDRSSRCWCPAVRYSTCFQCRSDVPCGCAAARGSLREEVAG